MKPGHLSRRRAEAMNLELFRRDINAPVVGGERPQARKDDPDTSKANVNIEIDKEAAAVVLAVMADGKPRIDEEIVADSGEWSTRDGRIRHGRLALQDAGLIVETGKRRPTSNGGMSREWKLSPLTPALDAKPATL